MSPCQPRPHLTFPISPWSDTTGQAQLCQPRGQSTLNLQEHLEADGRPDSDPAARPTLGLLGQLLTPQSSMVTSGAPLGLGISCLVSAVYFGYCLGNCHPSTVPPAFVYCPHPTSRPLSAQLLWSQGGGTRQTCQPHPTLSASRTRAFTQACPAVLEPSTLAEAEWQKGTVGGESLMSEYSRDHSLLHRKLPSLPPSWHQDLPISKLTLQQGSDFGQQALFVNMLLICNFENKIETSCILKYKMKCDTLYTI